MTQPCQAKGPRGAESSPPAEAAAGVFRARRMTPGLKLLRSLSGHVWKGYHPSTSTVPSSLEAACTEVPRHFQGRENRITKRRCLAEGSTQLSLRAEGEDKPA